MTAVAQEAVKSFGQPPAHAKPILELKHVATSYMVRAGELKVIPEVSLTLHEGQGSRPGR